MAILKIMPWKEIRIIRLLLIFISMIISCSELNQPIIPGVVFTKWERDWESGSYINFYNSSNQVDIYANWDIESYYYPIDVKIYIRKRNENEYVTKQLSDQPFTCCIVANLTKSTLARGKIVSNYNIIDSCGNILEHKIAWSEEDYLVSIGIDTIPISPSSLFFWQAEFYLGGDTLRIPEKPGIWYFN